MDMKPNECVGEGGRPADPNTEPIYYIPSQPWPDKPPLLGRMGLDNADGPVLLWHESLLERRAWEALMQLVKRDGYCSSTSIQHSFTIAEMFAAEAAKRRTGGV